MTQTLGSLPNEIFFHVVERPMSAAELVAYLYNNPTQATEAHFKAINTHIEGDRVRPGQLVVITPRDNAACSAYEATLAALAADVEQAGDVTSEPEAETLNRHYELIGAVAQYGSGVIHLVGGGSLGISAPYKNGL